MKKTNGMKMWEPLIETLNENGPKCLVLFDGIGLSRLGLLQAGYHCCGVEIDATNKIIGDELIKFFGYTSRSVCANVLDIPFDLMSKFDAIWASPPCQTRSMANIKKDVSNPIVSQDLLQWSLNLKGLTKTLWVENVYNKTCSSSWGTKYNQVQFQLIPTQSRCRIIGGNYTKPKLLREFKEWYPNVKGVRYVMGENNKCNPQYIPAKNEDCSLDVIPPGYVKAFNALPNYVVDLFKTHYFKRIIGPAPTLLASEYKAPGSVTDIFPKTHPSICNDRIVLEKCEQQYQQKLWALIKRETYFKNHCKMCARYYRRRILPQEMFWIMTVLEEPRSKLEDGDRLVKRLKQIKPEHTFPGIWEKTIVHGIGNGVPVIMARIFGKAQLKVTLQK